MNAREGGGGAGGGGSLLQKVLDGGTLSNVSQSRWEKKRCKVFMQSKGEPSGKEGREKLFIGEFFCKADRRGSY